MAAPVIPASVQPATIAWLWTAAIGAETTVPTGLTVTFDPAPEWLQYTAAAPHMTIAPWSVTGTIDTTDGTLRGPDGTANVTLLPTDDTDLNPNAWTYQVTVRQGSLVLMNFPIEAPGGVTTDLSDVVPIAGSTGNAVVKGDPGPPLTPKGTKATTGALPSSGNAVGDLWTVTADGHAYVWSGSVWVDQGQWTGSTGAGVPAGGAALQYVRKNAGNTTTEWATLDADAITDATTVGKNVLTAASAAAARTAIGAGTSSLVVGTGATDAMAGNKVATDLGGASATDPRFVGVPVSTKTADYTLVAGDAGSIVEMDKSTAITLTVPNSTFSAGQIVEICQIGAGQVTLAAGSGVTLRSADGLKISAQYGSASIRFRSATEAVVSGSMTT